MRFAAALGLVFVLSAAVPVTALAENRVVLGKASTYGEGYNGWLALPEGPGHRVKICIPGTTHCALRTSNDAGPDLEMQRAGRVVDLDVPTFEYLCQCAWRSLGVIDQVTVEYLDTNAPGVSNDHPEATPPPTDTGGSYEYHPSPFRGTGDQSSADYVRAGQRAGACRSLRLRSE